MLLKMSVADTAQEKNEGWFQDKHSLSYPEVHQEVMEEVKSQEF